MSSPTVPVPAPRRTPRPLRIALTVIVAVLALATIFNGAWILLSEASRDSFTTRVAFAGVRSLSVANDAGDVELVSARAGTPVRVTTNVTRGLTEPNRRALRTAGGGLRLTASCPSDFNATACAADYRIAVPAGTQLVRSTSGDVSVTGFASRRPVRLESSDGDIEASDVQAPALKLQSSGGSVTATGVRAPLVSAESSADDVEVDMLSPPRRLTAISSAGDVRITVPDAVYAVDASSSAGAVRDSGIRIDPHSPRKIVARSSAGDVVIETGRGQR